MLGRGTIAEPLFIYTTTKMNGNSTITTRASCNTTLLPAEPAGILSGHLLLKKQSWARLKRFFVCMDDPDFVKAIKMLKKTTSIKQFEQLFSPNGILIG